MKCVFCKEEIELSNMMDHMKIHHPSMDDKSIDPDYEPPDITTSGSDTDEYFDSDVRPARKFPLKSPTTVSAFKADQTPNLAKFQPLTEGNVTKQPVQKTKQRVLKRMSQIDTKKIERKKSKKENTRKDSLKTKTTLRKDSSKTKQTVKNDTVKQKQTLKQDKLKIKLKSNVLPPLKPWKRKEKVHRPRTANRSQGLSPTSRKRIICKICYIEVTHLPRHLRDAHDFTRENSVQYAKVQRAQLRGIRTKRPYYKCPVRGCKATVQWLQQHLKGVHHLNMRQTEECCKYKKSVLSDTDSDQAEIETDFAMEEPEKNRCIEEAPSTSQIFEESAQSDITQVIETEDTGVEPFPCSQIIDEKFQSDERPVKKTEFEEIESWQKRLPITQVIKTEDTEVETFLCSEIIDEKSQSDERPEKNTEFEEIESWQKHKVLKSFYKWLESTESGKTKKSAEQHAAQVFKIWKKVDSSMSLQTIVDGDSIRSNFFDRKEGTPGTRKSYLCSLRLFYNFMRFNDIEGHEKVPKLLIQTDRWACVLNKENAEHRTGKQVQDYDDMISPVEIQTMLESDVCQDIKDLFTNSKPDDPINVQTYCRMRNFLILMILITNGQRTGAIMNLNMIAIKNASVNNTGDAHLFIATHKTCKSGPVNLVLSKELWQQLNIFIVNMRIKLPGTTSEWLNADDTPVFLSYPSGVDRPSRMSQSRINMALQSIWVKLKQESNISATRLRKAVVTHVRDVAPNERESLAQQMTHNATTADKYYLLHQKKVKAFSTVQLITKVMTNITSRKDIDSESPKRIEEKSTIDNKPDVNLVSEDIHSASQKKSEEFQAIQNYNDQEIVTPQHDNEQEPDENKSISQFIYTAVPIGKVTELVTTHGRRAFSKEDGDFLVSECRFMVTNPPITQSRIADTLSTTVRGREFIRKYEAMYGRAFLKKAADRIQTERKKTRKSDL